MFSTSKRLILVIIFALVTSIAGFAMTSQTTHAAAPAPGAVTAQQAAQMCPLAPGQSGSVQLFDNQGGDAYYAVKNCGGLVVEVVKVNYTATNNTEIYFVYVGGVLTQVVVVPAGSTP